MCGEMHRDRGIPGWLGMRWYEIPLFGVYLMMYLAAAAIGWRLDEDGEE